MEISCVHLSVHPARTGLERTATALCNTENFSCYIALKVCEGSAFKFFFCVDFFFCIQDGKNGYKIE